MHSDYSMVSQNAAAVHMPSFFIDALTATRALSTAPPALRLRLGPLYTEGDAYFAVDAEDD